MKRFLSLFLILIVLCGVSSHAEETAVIDPAQAFDLALVVELQEGETLHLMRDASYYSGGAIYKGNTKKELTGACTIHCAAVVISNRLGKYVSGQEVAKANNISKRSASSWSNFVAWGKVGNAYDVSFESLDLTAYMKKQKKKGMTTADRRQMRLDKIMEVMTEHGECGLILHFNITGKLNGSGRRHAIVVLGYIEKDGEVTDLVVSDSSIDAPRGACVRLTQSTVLSSMRLTGKDQVLARMMDYAVSCRYLEE